MVSPRVLYIWLKLSVGELKTIVPPWRRRWQLPFTMINCQTLLTDDKCWSLQVSSSSHCKILSQIASGIFNHCAIVINCRTIKLYLNVLVMFYGSRLFPWKFFVVVTPNQYYRVQYDVRCKDVVYVFMRRYIAYTSPLCQFTTPSRARACMAHTKTAPILNYRTWDPGHKTNWYSTLCRTMYPSTDCSTYYTGLVPNNCHCRCYYTFLFILL